MATRTSRPRRSRGPHALVVAARQPFEDASTEVERKIKADIFHIFPPSEYLKPRKQLIVDIFVSRKAITRAFDVASAVFGALEHRGHRVVIAPHDAEFQRPGVDPREQNDPYSRERWSPLRPTVAYVGTVAVGLTLYERSENVLVRTVGGVDVRVPPSETRSKRLASERTHRRDMPSGLFVLRAFSPYPRASWRHEWSEERKGDLDDQLEAIVDAIEKAAPLIADLVAEGERKAVLDRQQWEAAAQERLRVEKAQRDAAATKASKDQLSQLIAAWADATKIEAFFEAARARAAALGADDRAAVASRIERARALFPEVDAHRLVMAWKAPGER